MAQALSYEEPSLVHLLVLASFIYATNATRIVADYFLYARIVAEIVLGIAYGSPLAGLLSVHWESTFTALGYIGLILVVFEGGLSTNLPVLVSNLPLSTVCTLTGICLPIAFSVALLNAGFGYRPLEAFAAGSALVSTSLGTTLAALNSVTKSRHGSEKANLPDLTGLNTSRSDIPISHATPRHEDMNASTPTLSVEPSLQQSRIGTVLISAAIIDDVIALVIASLIPALAEINTHASSSGDSNLAWTIVRPLLSSFLIAVVGSVVTRLVLRPLFWYRGMGERWCAPERAGKQWGILGLSHEGSGWGTEVHADAFKLFLMIAVISAMAAITSYTGTSVLYGAYVAGLILTYVSKPPITIAALRSSGRLYDSTIAEETERREKALSFEDAFARTIGPLQNYFFLPLFFASIGFAIPFLDLWHPTVFWRGIVYSILMCIAKLAVGLPILLYPTALSSLSALKRQLWGLASRIASAAASRVGSDGSPHTSATAGNFVAGEKNTEVPPDPQEPSPSPRTSSTPPSRTWYRTAASLPAAVFMGVAMVSRGEIGLLIAQIARIGAGSSEASGLFGEEAFLVSIWAILLCTLIGPVSVGFVVRRWGSKVIAGIWS